MKPFLLPIHYYLQLSWLNFFVGLHFHYVREVSQLIKKKSTFQKYALIQIM